MAGRSGYLLIGAVGGPNFGDEAIMFAWVKTIHRWQPNASIWCDGYNIANVKLALTGKGATSIDADESLWGFVQTIDERFVWSPVDSYPFNAREKLRNIAQSLRAKNVGIIHVIGGGYLNALWRKNYLLLTIARWLAYQIGARLVATGQGLVPIKDGDVPQLKAILGQFDYVDVRDRSSWRLIRDLGGRASRSGDDALLFFDVGGLPIVRTANPELIICLQNDLFDGLGASNQLLNAEVCHYIKSNGIKRIAFIEAMAGDFISPTVHQTELLLKHGISWRSIDRHQLLIDGLPFHKCSIVITSRYHPHFFFALTGMRGCAVASNSYYMVKHCSVRRYGSNWPIHDTPNIRSLEGAKRVSSLRHLKTSIALFLKRNLVSQIYGATPLPYSRSLPWSAP